MSAIIILQYLFTVCRTVLHRVCSWCRLEGPQGRGRAKPISVNYHFTRHCNYSCGFCFHTAKNNDVLDITEITKGLTLLKQSGMKKINFAGGEPFLYPKLLGDMAKFCKENLQLESVSIVTNSSKITASWFQKYGQYIDVLAVSVDSFDEKINEKIGRGKGNHLESVKKAQKLCLEHNIKFKINTVVNKFNFQENLSEKINELNPCRWKVFKVLVLTGENDGNGTLRDATKFEITDKEFNLFLKNHSHIKSLVPENNDMMLNSYLVLDEKMRFLDSSSGGKEPSESILDVGVDKAMSQSGYDENKFTGRGGIYDWRKNAAATTQQNCGSSCTKSIPEW